MSELELQREEWIEERAGMLEYEAGLPREVAEKRAAVLWSEINESEEP